MAAGRQGRPPSRAPEGTTAKVTARVPARTKNLLAEMADLYGLTISEYIQALVDRDASETDRTRP